MKSHKVEIIVLSLLLLVSIAFNVYFVITKTQESNKVDVTGNKVASNNNNTTNNQTQIIEKGVYVPFDATKVKNQKAGDKYSLLPESCLYADFYLDGNKVTIELNDEVSFKKAFPSSVLKSGTKYTVENVEGNVVEIYVGTVGNGINYPVLLLLMSDGTVQAVDTKTGYTTGKFQSKGKITELVNIVRFEAVNCGVQAFSRTIVAIDKDGNSYDIMNTNAKTYYES